MTVDISAEREREQQDEAQEPRTLTRDELDRAIITAVRRPRMEDVIEFTPEQAQRIMAADEFIQEGMAMLERLSTREERYGVPQNIEQVALLNAMFGLLVEKGVITMAEVFVAKREAIAEQMEQVVAGARAHKREATSKLVVPGHALHEQPDAPPLPPRKQRKQQRRRGR